MEQLVSLDLRAPDDIRVHAVIPAPYIGPAQLGGPVSLIECDSCNDAARGALVHILAGN